MEKPNNIDNLFAEFSGTLSTTDENVCEINEGEGQFQAESSNKSADALEDEIDLMQFFCKPEEAEELSAKEVVLWESKDLVGKSFPTMSAAEGFYHAYSRKMGFGVRQNNKSSDTVEGILTMRRMVCHRMGKTRKKKSEVEQKRKCMSRTRCECKAAFVVRYNKTSLTYKVSTFNSQHNHQLASQGQTHFFRCNRKMTEGQKSEIRTMKAAGIKTCTIMDYMVAAMGGFDKLGFIKKDLYNFITWDHERTTTLDTDTEATIAYLTALKDIDPGLYIRYALDEDQKLTRLFWRDSTSKRDYELFGDVVVIDSTYKTNTFRLPLVEFVGVNNHKSTIIFVCCLIADETVDAYNWAFKAFIDSMGFAEPACVITDGDKAIASALTTQMPLARHRLCSWHLMRNARVVSASTTFLSDLGRLMRPQNSEEVFENEWRSLLENYKLERNGWMKELYDRRAKWAEPFFEGVFCAGMNTSQRVESVHAYMNHFVSSDLSLYTFVKQFSRATCRMRQQTLNHDFINNQTQLDLGTHLKGLETTALNFYTRAVFREVREEMKKESKYTPIAVESEDGCKTVIMVKYGDETAAELRVTIRNSDKYIFCPCGRFESVGWPCRHMFCAMKTANMTSVPEVLLKSRWSKECTPNGGSISNNELSTTNPMDRRFGKLHQKIYQICQIASTTHDLFKLAFEDLDNTMSRLCLAQASCKTPDSQNNKRKRLHVDENKFMKNPDVVRTKGCQSDAKTNKGKPRKCGICRQPGHYKSNCPILKDEPETEKCGSADIHPHEEGDDDEYV